MPTEIHRENDSVYFTFGRFQPPTIGHALLIEHVIAVSLAKKGDYYVIPYASVNKIPAKLLKNPSDEPVELKKTNENPLELKDKIYYLEKMFPDIHLIDIEEYGVKTIFEIVNLLASHGYKNIYLVVGSDRQPTFEKLFEKYKSDQYYFEVLGVPNKRDSSAKGAVGMSGTKMRSSANECDFDSFLSGIPISNTMTKKDAKTLMNLVRKGLGQTEC